jgi:hypothetical protein
MRRILANSRTALILRRLRSRFGVSAPRMSVRTHVPWYWRAATAVLILAVSIALAGWIYDLGRRFAGFDRSASDQEMTALKERVVMLEGDLAKTRSVANAGESSLNIERTTAQQLTQQVRKLEADNARLKEDLAVFENLASADGKPAGVDIQQLNVDFDQAANQLRYRFLVVAQGIKREKETKVRLQFQVLLQQGGKTVMMNFPASNQIDGRFVISFKHFRRIDGLIPVPAGARVLKVEARLMQDGAAVTTQAVNL